jgi:hypothetical protein
MCIQPDRSPINQGDPPPLILLLPTTPTPSHRQHPYSLRYPTALLLLDLTIDPTSKLALLHPTTFHQRSLHLYRTGDHPQPTPPPTPQNIRYSSGFGVRRSSPSGTDRFRVTGERDGLRRGLRLRFVALGIEILLGRGAWIGFGPWLSGLGPRYVLRH